MIVVQSSAAADGLLSLGWRRTILWTVAEVAKDEKASVQPLHRRGKGRVVERPNLVETRSPPLYESVNWCVRRRMSVPKKQRSMHPAVVLRRCRPPEGERLGRRSSLPCTPACDRHRSPGHTAPSRSPGAAAQWRSCSAQRWRASGCRPGRRLCFSVSSRMRMMMQLTE